MKALKAYGIGWREVFRKGKMWLLLYVLSFLFALLAALPFSGFLKETLGDSLAATQSLPGFNYTFVGDLLNTYGESISLILNQSIGVMILFVLLSIFLMGGILVILQFRNEAFDFSRFWMASGRYFWRLLRLTIYFTIFQLLLLSIFAYIYSKLLNGLSPFETESEADWIRLFYILAPIYTFLAMTLSVVQDYAKIHIVHQDERIITKPFWESFIIVFKNFIPFFLLYLLNTITFLIFFGLYYVLGHSFQAHSMPTVALLFLLGQAYIFFRIGVKIVNLAGATYLYQEIRSTDITN